MTDGPHVPWRWVFAGLVVILTLLALGFALWLRQHADLDRIEARMRAVGIDPNDLQSRSVPDIRWQALTNRCPSICIVEEDAHLVIDPGATIRPDTASADEIIESVFTIPTTAVCDYDEVNRLLAVINARVISGNESAAVRSAQALCHIFWSLDTSFSYPHAVAAELVTSIRRRRQYGRPFHDQLLAPELRRMADEIEHRLRQPWGFPLAPLLARARSGGDDFVRHTGIRLPEIYYNWLGYQVVSRAGREAYFTGYLQWYEQSRSALDARALVRVARSMQQPTRSPIEWASPAVLLDSRDGAVWVTRRAVSISIHLRLMAADLDGGPWPDDPFALTPAPLHRAERDGMLMGAWSVGLDGIDQSGSPSKDVCLSLGPKNGNSKMTDPPRPPLK